MSRDRTKGRLFDNSAAAYAAARPGYPREVYDVLRDECGLRSGVEILEVGAGAGQATAALLDAGARVTSVEPGASFAEHLRRLADPPALEVIIATFEEAELSGRQFDLVTSATAFHWVDPHIGIPKVVDALKEGGTLAVWATLYGDPDRPDPFHAALLPILEQHAPELIPPPKALAAAAPRGTFEWIEVAQSSGAFEPVKSRTIRWEGRHDAEGLRSLFATFSPWLALADEKREAMLAQLERLAREEFSNEVVRPYRTVMHWTRSSMK